MPDQALLKAFLDARLEDSNVLAPHINRSSEIKEPYAESSLLSM